MGHLKFYFLLTAATLLFSACQSLKQSSKYGFNEGFYKSRLFHKKIKSVYVLPGEDSIKVYSAKRLLNATADTNVSVKIAFPANEKPERFENYLFKQTSFDLDILSILLKYRPQVKGFPNQLNTSILNGVLYLGYRTDLFHLHYKQNALRRYKREVSHYGFSIGVFTGIGASRIDPFVTLGALNIEYDGFVNPSGIAAILAMNKLSFSLALGVDHLLDKNRRVWIYQGKPWIGLGVGLNLN